MDSTGTVVSGVDPSVTPALQPPEAQAGMSAKDFLERCLAILQTPGTDYLEFLVAFRGGETHGLRITLNETVTKKPKYWS